jgi:4-amino-4-deoxy-L-arabinose transferase-like glycosyltransferase
MTVAEKSGMAATAGSWKRGEILTLAVVITCVFLFRLYNLQTYDVISADGTSYGPIGRGFFQSGSFRVFGTISGPVYSFLVGLLDLVLHDLERSLRLVSVIFSTATVVVVYLFARTLFGVTAAMVAALIGATLPFLHGMSGIDIIEPTFGFFLVSAALVFWHGYLRSSARLSTAAGVLMGIAYLSRSEGFICWFALTVFLAAGMYRTMRAEIKRLFLRVMVPFCLGFFILFVPYLIYLHGETGKWQLSGKSGLNAQVIREYLGKGRTDQKFSLDAKGAFDEGKNESLSRLIKEEPELYKQNIRKNLVALPAALAESLTWYLLLAAVIAFACSPWTRRYLLARAILVGICSPMVIYLLFFVQPRGLYPYVAFLCVWAGGGIALIDKLRPRMWQRFPVSLAIAVVLCAYFVYLDFPRAKPPYQYTQDGGRQDDKHIGQRLKQLLPADAVIMTRSGRIAFYAEKPMVIPPQASYGEIIAYARKNRVTHLIVTYQIMNMRPQLAPLFGPLNDPGVPFEPPPEFRLIYAGAEAGGLPYIVYQIMPQALTSVP